MQNAYDDSIVLVTARVRLRALAQGVYVTSWLKSSAVTREVGDALASLAGVGGGGRNRSVTAAAQ